MSWRSQATEHRPRDRFVLGDTSASHGEEARTLLDSSVAFTRERFIDALVRRGFRLESDDSQGAVSRAVLLGDDLSIELNERFPFLPPLVLSKRPEAISWHRDALGYMCLYTSLDHEHRPWLDVDAFLERVTKWRRENARGWPEDPPALDLEPYLGLALDPRFIVYQDLDRFSDKFVLFTQNDQQVRLAQAGRVSKRRRRRQLGGFVLDVGELRRPPPSWLDLLDGHPAHSAVAAAVDSGRLDILLVRYARNGQRATAAITFAPLGAVAGSRSNGRHETFEAENTRQAFVAHSGAADDVAMRLRSGEAAPRLGGQRVCVIGAGALGSYVCDGLIRAGLGQLTIRDFDVLRPGNMTRHLVGNLAYAGLNKAVALRAFFATTAYSRAEIDAHPNGLLTLADALTLIREHDLVVDASADGAATTIMRAAAEATGATVVIACLQNDGKSLRVDIVPPLGAAEPLADTPLRAPRGPEVFDGGCGLPLSPTPPHAVQEAAAIAVRHVIALLSGDPLTPSGEVREL